MLNQLSQECKKGQKKIAEIIEKEEWEFWSSNQFKSVSYWQKEIQTQVIVVGFLSLGVVMFFLGAILTANQWWWYLALIGLLLAVAWGYYLILCMGKLRELYQQWQKMKAKVNWNNQGTFWQKFSHELWRTTKEIIVKKINSKEKNAE